MVLLSFLFHISLVRGLSTLLIFSRNLLFGCIHFSLLTSLIVFLYSIDSYSDVFISFYLIKKKKPLKKMCVCVCVCSLLITFLKEIVEIVTLCWLRLHTNPWNISVVHLKAMFYPICLSFSRNWSLEGKL